ncbi:prolyl endopeptidase FAP-like isoform X2 [Antedon mediterranea]|uniref:prolyl endopeptidase FAP-like isoform X2 n=1 Tax=Antedon mediterranea TaxID=105859 RepID=UPI003AF469C4
MFPAVLRQSSRPGGQGDSGDDHLGQVSASISRLNASYTQLGGATGSRQKMELVGGNQEQRNWKGIIISLLVIILICTIIIVCILIVTPDEKFYESYTFDDIFRNDSFKIKKFELSWLQAEGYETSFLYQDEYGNIILANASSNPGYQIMDNRTLFRDKAVKFWASPKLLDPTLCINDCMYLLLACDVQKVFRHSFKAKYKVYKISLGNYNADDGDQDGEFVMDVLAPGNYSDDYLQLVQWSPYANSLVIVYNNNIYYNASVSDDDKVVQITSDGIPNQVFNGVPDWLYEEEIIGGNSAIYWSSASNRFAFIRFDDRNVAYDTWPVYENKIYPESRRVAYPKPGGVNPTVTLYVVLDATVPGVPLEIKIPTERKTFGEYYIQSVTWSATEELVVTWMNRQQNVSLITKCDVNAQMGEACKMVAKEQESESGWVAMPAAPVFTDDKRSFVQIMPQSEGASGRYNHIVYFKENVPEKRLTEGKYEVSKIFGIDKENNVYFSANKGGLGTKHIYSLSISDDNPSVECLSCGMACAEPCNKCDECEYFNAVFNPSMTWLLLNCEGPGIPCSWIREARANGDNEIRKYLLENNTVLQEAIKNKGMPKKKFLPSLTNAKGQKIPVQLIMPINYDEKRAHPLLINVYGGPGSQKVSQAFELGWSMYLASNDHIATASIDGRGSGGQGENFRHELYKGFGTVEVEDQIDITKKMLNEYSFLDPTRVAIWGWSYGGFVAASVAGSQSDVFNCSIAVAPVTDWRYYDSAYTERYMGDPHINKAAYMKSNVSSKARGFKDVSFLVAHGTGDDNVHFQNSADLVRALVQEEVMHQTQFYPDQAHALEDRHVQYHLYRLLSNFLTECLRTSDIPEE